MLRCLDLLGGVGQGAEGEGLAGLFQGQLAAVCQLQNHLLGVHVQAAVLGNQRRGDVGHFLVAAEYTALVTVGISLAGQAGPLGAGHGGKGLEFHAEARQLRCAGHTMVDGIHPQGGLGLYRIGDLHAGTGHQRHTVLIANLHPLLGLFQDSAALFA